MKIDFSYKDNPLKITYDIESTPNLFTLAMIHDKAMSLIIFGDHQFDDLDEKDLVKQMRRFASKKYNKNLKIDTCVQIYKKCVYFLLTYFLKNGIIHLH